MAIEDFTTYTEVDPNSHITIDSAAKITQWLDRNEDAYLYKDKGVDHFPGDFEILFEHRSYLNGGDANKLTNIMGLSNQVDDMSGWAAHGLVIECDDWEGHPLCYLLIVGVGYSAGAVLNYNTLYYCKLKRVGNVVTVYWYSDAARTIQVASATKTDAAKISARYLYACVSRNQAVTRPATEQYIQNVDCQDIVIVAPTVSTEAATLIEEY